MYKLIISRVENHQADTTYCYDHDEVQETFEMFLNKEDALSKAKAYYDQCKKTVTNVFPYNGKDISFKENFEEGNFTITLKSNYHSDIEVSLIVNLVVEKYSVDPDFVEDLEDFLTPVKFFKCTT